VITIPRCPEGDSVEHVAKLLRVDVGVLYRLLRERDCVGVVFLGNGRHGGYRINTPVFMEWLQKR
jgi:predicted transcriptional regulator